MDVVGIDAGQPHAPPGVYIRTTTAIVERPRRHIVYSGWVGELVEDPHAPPERVNTPVYAVYEDGEPNAVFKAYRRDQWKQALVWATRLARDRGDDVLTIGYPSRRVLYYPGYRPPKPKNVNITSALRSPRKHFTAMLDLDILD